MTNSQDDIEEIEKLQQETSELHAKRERAASKAASSEAASDKEQVAEAEKLSVPDEDEATQSSVSESESAVRDLAVQIENVVNELEDAAKERPALALLSAFMIGIVVGQHEFRLVVQKSQFSAMAVLLAAYARSLKPAAAVEMIKEVRDLALSDIEQEVVLAEAEMVALKDNVHRFIRNPADTLLPAAWDRVRNNHAHLPGR